MKRWIHLALFSAYSLTILNLCGCGGGGGSTGNDRPTKGTATIVFSTALPAGSIEQIGMVQLTFELPDGVTVPTDASGAIPNGLGGILTPSGEALKFAAQPNAVMPVVMGKYTPATPTSKATVNFGILVTPLIAKGMNPGVFATLVCDLTTGMTIDLTQFQRTSLLIGNVVGAKLYDSQGGITGPASASYTVTLQYDKQTMTTGATSGSGNF